MTKISSYSDTDQSPVFYRRYVDDIFCVLRSKDHLHSYLTDLNNRHPSIKFTVEEETNGMLPFLDILTNRTDDLKFTTTSYIKPTNTGLLTNFTSFTAQTYKTGLIKTLIDRAYKINSTLDLLKNDLERISTTLQKNMFPLHVIDRVMQRAKNTSLQHETTPTGLSSQTRYFKLPFIGSYSKLTQSKVSNLMKQHCLPEISIKLIFETFKVGQYFSKKDAIPSDLRSHVVYKFVCAGCGACYIGETNRHLSVRMDEHLRTDKNSHIYKHNENNVLCGLANDNSSFQVLDSAQTKQKLRFKEAWYIKRDNPSLNRQVHSLKLNLM